LQYNLARDLLEITGKGKGEGYFPHMYILGESENLLEWGHDNRLHLVKSHVHPESIPGREDGSVRFLYVHRDLRAVAASLKKKWEIEGSDLLDSLSREVRRDRALERQDSILVQRYSAFVSDLPGSVRTIASFLGLNVQESLIRKVAERNNLKRTRERIEQLKTGPGYWINWMMKCLGVRRDVYDDDSLLHTDHITSRNPAKSQWQETLSELEKEVIEKEFTHWLDEKDYD